MRSTSGRKDDRRYRFLIVLLGSRYPFSVPEFSRSVDLRPKSNGTFLEMMVHRCAFLLSAQRVASGRQIDRHRLVQPSYRV